MPHLGMYKQLTVDMQERHFLHGVASCMLPLLLLVTPRPCTCKVILIHLTGSPHLVNLCFVSALLPCLRQVDVCLHLRNSLYNKWTQNVTCEVSCGRKEATTAQRMRRLLAS